jgi:lipoyl(octanoyl) transferase
VQVVALEGPVPYHDGWARQRALHEARRLGTAPDTLLLLEHEPVYTAGRRTAVDERPLPGTTGGAEVVEVDRGGKITWHGPGQLTGYPILALPDPVDVVAHVRRMEQLVIDVCAELGLAVGRVDGRSGVWVPADERGPARKVAAVGVRVARGVTMHGFALNVDCDLGWFGRIVPCGITDAGVTSLQAELGTPITVADVRPLVAVRAPTLTPWAADELAAAQAPRAAAI